MCALSFTSEDLGERVTVEAQTFLLVWFGPNKGSSCENTRGTVPHFLEVKLLWPSLPPSPGQPQPLSFRLLDFSADVMLDDRADLPTGGPSISAEAPATHEDPAWLANIAGHFREVSRREEKKEGAGVVGLGLSD